MHKKSRVVFIKLSIVGCAALLAAFGFLSFSAERFNRAGAFARGPIASQTGAPGETNCTSCHTGAAVNSGSGNVAITGVPANYLPNQQIPVTVTVSQSDAVIYGFQLTALDAQGRKVGTFTLPEQTPMQTQFMTGFVSGNERQYVEHTQDGITPVQFGSKSWTFTWTAPAQRIGAVSFYAAGNAANSDNSTSGDYIYTTSKTSVLRNPVSNFDADGKTDVAVFRPSTGEWFSLKSSDGAFSSQQFGSNGDRPVAGDFDGDGKSDYAVWRESDATWYILQSSSGFRAAPFGQTGDRPLVGDYDGDGRTDLSVFRPSNGVWYIFRSRDGYVGYQFGIASDKTAQGDFDGDGKTDVAVFRPSTGEWFINQTRDGFISVPFGISEDKPVPAEYDGDGRTDVAVFRPSTGDWYRRLSGSGNAFSAVHFGASGDKPAAADFDGDGKTDTAVFRPSTGVWHILRSSDNFYYGVFFGNSTDIPIPSSGFIAD
jgi:hypothetical protein